MKSHISSASLLLGIIIGAWLMMFFMHYIVQQEFSGLEAAGNADYTQIKNELLDDAILVPLSTVIPLTIGLGLAMAVIGWSKERTKK